MKYAPLYEEIQNKLDKIELNFYKKPEEYINYENTDFYLVQ